MDGLPIIARQEAILFKIQSAAGTDANPAANVDAIPFEAGSWSNGSDTQFQASTEVGIGLASGAPLVIGQPVTLSFQFQLKGAGAGTTYSGSVTPPHHAVYRAAGLRGVFTAAIATAVATAGTTTTATLGTGFGTTAQMYRGMPFNVTAGPNANELLLCSDYTAGKVATFADMVMGTAFTTSSSLALIANWTYAPTSPADAAARATDHPLATVHYMIGGKRRRFIDVRGSISMTGGSSRPGIATFTGTGVYVGEDDSAFPSTLAFASHSAPLLLQGANVSEAFLINRRALAIDTWTLTTNQQVEAPSDPNSVAGFAEGIIGGRDSQFSCDPLQTFVATRNTLADIKAGSRYPGMIRAGYTSGNRWGLTMPVMQPVDRGDGSARAGALTEALQLKLINPGSDSNTRDNEFILTFY
ncbi:MAG: hypothetical protein B7Y35_06095 [Sphingomonadales bacterium 28-64-96]|nr:MAG: hypothetical protein B7Y35_06095 [Sphingomonadales bacterium 28-64-96]